MLTFTDLLGERVELTFGENRHGMPTRDVLVVLQYNGQWLLTEHASRGIEFPGGKVEEGESLETAAIREVIEETGVTLTNLSYVAEYVVHAAEPFCKAIYTGEVRHIEAHPQLHETKGVVWMTSQQLDACENLSFYMKDDGMTVIRKWVEEHES